MAIQEQGLFLKAMCSQTECSESPKGRRTYLNRQYKRRWPKCHPFPVVDWKLEVYCVVQKADGQQGCYDGTASGAQSCGNTSAASSWLGGRSPCWSRLSIFRECPVDTASSTRVSTHQSIAHRDVDSSTILMRAKGSPKSIQHVLPSIAYRKHR